MSMLAGFREFLHKKQYQIEVTFSIYMFTPWEKFAFYSIVFLLAGLTFIAAILYLPHHISILAGRAWYYINGDHIDVAASAREVVKDMSVGVFGGALTTTTMTTEAASNVAAAVKEAAETVVREL